MTKWTFRENPENSNILISKQIEDKKEVILGEIKGTLHGSLIEIAAFFEPGDIVETPEGPSWVHGQSGEINN
jgi:hypothetical protein